MSPVSSAAGLSQAYDVAMMGKVQDQAKLQGRATLELLASADVPMSAAPAGTGSMIDDVA